MLPLISPEAEVETIRTFGIIIAALIAGGFGYLGVAQERTRRHAKAAREQVQNTHETNLRDDLDDLKEDVNHRFTRLEDHLGIERTLDANPYRRRPRPSRWRRR